MPILFLKATGAPRKYANMPGYVKVKGHWVRANKDIKAPAGAPKAAHPEAHAKGKPFHMPEEHAKQLMYPEEKAAANHEMKNFNTKHVPNLLAHAKEGDVTAILGHKYGTNTHAKKLMTIANHLLEQMGSSHKVSLGQQAGAHEAISKHPKEKGEQTPAEAPKASEKAAQAPETPSPKEEAKEAVADVADAIQEPVQETPSPAAEKKPSGKLEMPAFMSGKKSTGVRTAYEGHAQKIMDAVEAKDIHALQALVNPAAGAWKGKTSNSQMLLGLYGQALSKLQQSGQRFTPVTDEPSPVAAVETLASTTAQPKPAIKADASAVAAIDWDSFKTPDNIKSSKGYNKQLDAVKGAAEAGDVYGILALKYGTNTYAKKVAAAANMALIKLGHPNLKVVLGKTAVHPLLENLPQPTEAAKEEQATGAQVQQAKDDGPKDGETRMGKNGMLVFHDGHWHKQDTDEPVSEKAANAKPQAGQQVTPSQMKDLPAGTIVQTYDKDGSPSHQFMLGHFSAWFINANGKQHKKPIQKKQYLGLVGIDQEKSSGYTGGYHADDHPTTIVKMGGKNWVSDKMKLALKAMYPGAKAMSYPAVYSIHGGEYMLITSPGYNVPGGIIIDEHGEWYGAQALADGYKDPTFAAIMAGQIPDAPDMAPALGLAPDVTAELPEPNIHPDYGIQSLVTSVQASLADSKFPLADHYIMEAAEKLKALDDGSEDSLKTMQWLVHAKEKAHEGAQTQPKPAIEPAPAPEVPEPAKMTPLPDFKTADEFFAWSKTPEADKWLDEGEVFYGGSDAWNDSPEAKKWDAWAEKHTKQMEAKWAEEKAQKEAEQAAHNGGEVTNQDHSGIVDDVFGAYLADDVDGAKQAVKNLLKKYGYSQSAIAAAKTALENIITYNDAAPFKPILDRLNAKKEGEPKEGDTRMGKNGLQKLINGHWVNVEGETQKGPKPAKPEGFISSTWNEAFDIIEAALENGDVGPIDTQIYQAEGLKGFGPEAIVDYGKAAKAWLNAQVQAQAKGTEKPKLSDSAANDTDWHYMIGDINEAVETGDMESLIDIIQSTTDMVTPHGKEMHKWATACKDWMLANSDKTSVESITSQIAAAGTSPMAQKAKALEIASQLGTEQAWKMAVKHFDEKGWMTIGLQVGKEAIKQLGVPPRFPKHPGLDAAYVDSLNEAVAAVKYLDKEMATKMLASHESQFSTYTSADGVNLYNYIKDLQQFLSGEEKEQHDFDGDLFAELLAQKVDEGTQITPEDDGPQEGDTKPGKNGDMLILKNGHWVKMFQDDIPAPVFTGDKKDKLDDAAGKILAALKEHGPDIFKETKIKITEHKTGKKAGAVTVKFGLQSYMVLKESPTPDYATFAKFALDVKSWATKTGKKAIKVTPKPSPATNPNSAANSDANGGIIYDKLPSVAGWEKVGGQLGSNEGEALTDEAGQKWYVKYPKDEKHAQAEVLAAAFYSALGLKAQDAQLVTKNGKLGIASKWTEGLKQGSADQLAAANGALDGFLADVWLGNRDVVGMGYDNLKIDKDGDAVRVDAGASFMFRAQGGIKEFGDDPTELETMLDPKVNHQTHSVFKDMTEADYLAAAAKLHDLPDAKIRIMVNAMGPGSKADRKALAETLINRKNAILAKFPMDKYGKPVQAKDPLNLTVDAERLPKRHDFENWNGPGAGLSSKQHLNQANNAVEKQIWEMASKGNLVALKDFKFQPIDPNTGEPKGEKLPISEYPSKHVVSYHADLVQILDEIANPPVALKLFHEAEVNSIEELDAAFPTKKFGTTVSSVAAQEKMGFWVALGRMAKKDLAKVTPKTFKSYPQAAISAAYGKYNAAGKLARAFINGIQASGAYNDLFRDGKEKDNHGNKLADVAQAALDFSTEQDAGTTITRWQNMSHDMVKKLLAAEDGTVFTTVGSMCSSYSPTATKGFGQHRVTIRYAEGARAVESFGSGDFPSEKEVTTLPGARFVILSKKMTQLEGKSGESLDLEVLMLPPDLGL